jgi:hypothetical protein
MRHVPRSLASVFVALVFLIAGTALPGHADDGNGEPVEEPVSVVEETEEDGGCAATGESLGSESFCAGSTYTITHTSYAQHKARSGYVYVGRQVQWKGNPYDSYNAVRVVYQRAWISSSDSSGNLNSPNLYNVEFGIMKPYVNHFHKRITGLSGSNVVKYWDYYRAEDMRSKISYRLNLRYYTDGSGTWYKILDG